MSTIIMETSEGKKTIEFGLHTRIMICLDDGNELTLHDAGEGLEIRTPRLNRRLALSPLAPGSIIVAVLRDE